MTGTAKSARTLSVALCLAAGVLAVACNKEQPQVPPATGSGGATALSGKPLRIAMIAKSSSDPAFLSARTGAEDRARELSAQIGAPIEIRWLTPPSDDGQVQAQRIQQAVNELVDAILISCSDDQRVSDAIDNAVARGVAVMTFDSDAPRSKRFSYCGVDDRKIGETVMAELAGVLGVNAKTPLQVAVLAGNETSPSLRRRVEGVTAEASRHPHLKVVGTYFHRETPQDAGAAMLRAEAAHPDIAGWAMVGGGWALYNKTLLSDLEAGAAKPRPKTGSNIGSNIGSKTDSKTGSKTGSKAVSKIVSVNAFPPQLIYVEKGYAPVLLAQPTYLWGAVGVETIVKKLVEKKEVPALISMDLVRVTAADLGTWARQLKAWGFGDVPEEYLRLK